MGSCLAASEWRADLWGQGAGCGGLGPCLVPRLHMFMCRPSICLQVVAMNKMLESCPSTAGRSDLAFSDLKPSEAVEGMLQGDPET